MSNTDSSDDDEMIKIKEAADPQFINDNMFKLTDDIKTNTQQLTEKKSQRYLDLDEEHYDDLKIPAEMQRFIGNKLSEIIDKQVHYTSKYGSLDEEIIEVNSQPEVGIRLCRDSMTFLDCHEKANEIKQTRPVFKRRKCEDYDYSDDEKTKCKTISVSSDEIISRKETKLWSTRANAKEFVYKRAKDGVFYIVAPINEFTANKNKNNWSDIKISGRSATKKRKKVKPETDCILINE